VASGDPLERPVLMYDQQLTGYLIYALERSTFARSDEGKSPTRMF